ncbi:hypothetical protein AB0G49_07140 [Streptomyces longwoodensis]|uniref:hypothetical protein n=1 Tax=Streptomyces longwoodensis TaxID=68231 RepID=UPI00340CF205
MSSAYAGTDLTAVFPDVSASGLGQAADPVTGQVTDAVTGHATDVTTGHATDAAAAHASDVAGHVAGHATDALGHAADAVADQVHDLIVPALIGLADLSGALMVTRLAIRGTVALAAFNNKVAEQQARLSRQQMAVEPGSECWRRAVETAAGLNARIAVLGVAPGGPGEPPLPAPVQPVGVALDVLWLRMAETERALRRVEAQRAARATARLPFQHQDDPDSAEWYDRLRTRRREALRRYAAGGPQPDEPTAGHPMSDTTARRGATLSQGAGAAQISEEDVLEEGAHLLARLPLSFSSESRELIDDCLLEARRAVGRRSAAVRRYLDEAALIAHKEAERSERASAARQDAALRLGVLRAPAPEGVGPLPDAAAAVAVLERVLADGAPPSPDDERTVQQALLAHSAALHHAYLEAALRRAVDRWADGSGYARSDAAHRDFAPAEWGGHYWLRVRLTANGEARVFTMRRPLSSEQSADPGTVAHWEALDAARCAESRAYVDRLSALTEVNGVRTSFVWSADAVLTGEPAPGLTDVRDAAAGAGGAGTSRTTAPVPPQRRSQPASAPRYRRRDQP